MEQKEEKNERKEHEQNMCKNINTMVFILEGSCYTSSKEETKKKKRGNEKANNGPANK